MLDKRIHRLVLAALFAALCTIMTLVIQVPERLTQAQKDALRKFEEAMDGTASSESEKPRKKGIFK